MSGTQIATIQDLEAFQDATLSKLDQLQKLIESRKDPERLVSKSELAKLLDCTPSTVDGMRRRGIIEAYYVGIGTHGHPKFRPSEVFTALQERAK